MLISKIINNFIFRIRYFGKVKFHGICCIDNDTFFEGNNSIYSNTYLRGKIGYGTYIAKDTRLNAVIGKFCSIGQRVNYIQGFHPTKKFVTTHPAFFSTMKQAGFTFVNKNKFEETRFVDDKKRAIKIGNDVWIGDDVKLFAGITIGNGAIVGANSLVTKDVEPYSIVCGIPAKTIGYRFDKKYISFLNSFCWWNKEKEWIIDNAELFDNIDDFMNEYENNSKNNY